MITKKEIITITRDDRMFELYDGFFTKQNGWTKEECTVSVTYTRIEHFHVVTQCGARMDRE